MSVERIKPKKLKKGAKIAIVSLSSGMLGEPGVRFELEIGKQRLEEYGFQVHFMPHALKGIEFVREHPELRARDLIEAFEDDGIDAVLCAIGGEDTFKLAPYLMENEAFRTAAVRNPKIFMGFSDTTNNHFMLHRLGLVTFYGQAFVTELAEISDDMLPYSRRCFENLFLHGKMEDILLSDIWYEERADYSEKAKGTERISRREMHGMEVLCGTGSFEGVVFGGCLESIHDMLTGERYHEEKEIIERYRLFPSREEWIGKILLLETSEEKASPEKFEIMLDTLQKTGIFEVLNGVIVGKPIDEAYYEEYKRILSERLKGCNVVYNINIGHATPRAILPLGVKIAVDAAQGAIRISESVFAD